MPILGFVSANERDLSSGSVTSILKELSIDPLAFEAEFDRLKRDSYIDGNIYKQAGMNPERWHVNSLRLLAKGARAIEQWPDTDKVYELLVQLLDGQIALASDTEDKGRLKKAKDMLTDIPHAACYSMALLAGIAAAGGTPELLVVDVEVRLGPDPTGGFRIPDIAITVRGKVGALDEAGFVKAAKDAKLGCPVGKALTGTTITLDAALA